MSSKQQPTKFTLPIEAARLKAREILDQFPQAGYAAVVENWRQLPDGQIEFTMRHLPTADWSASLVTWPPLKKLGPGFPRHDPIRRRYTSDLPPRKFHIFPVIGAIKFPTVALDQAGFAAPCRSLTALGFRRRGDRFLFARIADDRSWRTTTASKCGRRWPDQFCKGRPDTSSDGFSKMGRPTQYLSDRPLWFEIIQRI
jgi:hypothetical protein